MVFFMATIFGDVQYTKNGTVTNPCDMFALSLSEKRRIAFERFPTAH